MKYRVKELKNVFYIEVEKRTIISYGLFFRTKKDWVQASIIGYPTDTTVGDQPSKPFKTLDDAVKQINIWREGGIYHYID